jgi:hydroxymethylpyrimidine/phosphomethylpyrimidine kinase
VIIYKESDDDAKETQNLVEKEGRKCILMKGDVSEKSFRKNAED